MKKGTFYITKNNGYEIREGYFFEVEGVNFAVCKEHGWWTVTELSTGMACSNQRKTRKEAVQVVTENISAIKDCLETDKVKQIALEMKAMKAYKERNEFIPISGYSKEDFEYMAKEFQKAYSALYDGEIKETSERLAEGDKLMKEYKKVVVDFVRYTNDLVASDRETEAYCIAFKAMTKKHFEEAHPELKEEAQEGENEMKQKKKGTQRNQGMKMANDEVIRIHATRYHGLSKKNIRRIERKEKMATWERNVEHAGIEITFKEKPEKAVRDMLKSVGFRWHNAKQLWYAKETEARVKVAEMVCA